MKCAGIWIWEGEYCAMVHISRLPIHPPNRAAIYPTDTYGDSAVCMWALGGAVEIMGCICLSQEPEGNQGAQPLKNAQIQC